MPRRIPNTWDSDFDGYNQEWFKRLPIEKKQRYMEQDIERCKAHAEVLAGKMTGEAFVDLCIRQLRENFANIKHMPLGRNDTR